MRNGARKTKKENQKKQKKTTPHIPTRSLKGTTLEHYLKKRYTTKKTRAKTDDNYKRLSLGYEIYLARKKKNITQKQLAKKTKTQQSVIARIEAGKQNLSTDKLNEIGEVLGFELCLKKK